MNVRFGVAAVATIGCLISGGSIPIERATTGRVTVARVPHGGIQPQVVLDERGVLHMLYFAGDPAAGNLFYLRSTDFGSSFSVPVRANSQDGSAIATGTIRGGQLAIGRGGRVHVAWNGSDRAVPRGPDTPDTERLTSPFLYTRTNADGTAFEGQRNLIHRSYSLDGGGSIGADPTGNVYAAWHANAAGDPAGEERRRVWVALSQDEGATFSEEYPAWNEPTGACGCCGLRLFANGGGGLYLLYRSVTGLSHRDIFLLTSADGGKSFRGSRVHQWDIAACPMTSMSITADVARVLGAWETNGQVYFGEIDAAAARIPKPIAAPGDAAGRKHPRLSIGTNGATLLVWTEGMAWARGGSLAWQIFDRLGNPAGLMGTVSGVPAWSFAAAAPRPDGGFIIFY